jgi:hypothetical protein
MKYLDKSESLKECYYCENKFKVGKSAIGDHVIPDALGGKLSFLDVCIPCNVQLNDELDIHLVNLYKIQAMMLGIRPRKNKKGKSSVNFNEFNVSGIDNKLKAEVTSNGTMLKEQLIVNSEGKKIFIAPNQKIIDKKSKSKKKLPFDEIFIPNNSFGIGVNTYEVDSKTILRVLLKTCVNLIGAKKGIEYLKSLNLDELKSFIITGNNSLDKFKRITIYDKDKRYLKKYYHGVIIKKEESKLIGLVSIFGVLEKIILNDSYNDDFEEIEYFERYYSE